MLDEIPYLTLPQGWVAMAVGGLCQIVGGGTPSTSNEEYWQGNIPWITSADIYGLKDVRPRRHINERAVQESATNLLPSGSIIVVTRVGLGKVAFVREDLCFSQDSQGLVFDGRNLHGMYLSYFLSEAVKSFKYEGRGTTIRGVTKKKLHELPVLVPPLAEQHRIVSEIETQFTRLDASVAALRRAQANLKRYRASVLKDACEGRLVTIEAERARSESRDYEPAGVLLERILAERRTRWESQEKKRGKYQEPSAPDTSALPELPEGWMWAMVEQLSSRIQYGTSNKAGPDLLGVPVLRMGNIQNGELDFSDLKYLPSQNEEVGKTLLNPGDLVFNRTNSPELVGKSAVYKEGHPTACFASYLIRVSFPEVCVPDYVCFFINSQHGRSYIAQVRTQQVGQANVNGTKLAAMPIPLPPLAEQRRIVAEVERRLSVVQQAEATVEASLARAERLRQSILKQAFSGKLVPQDPDDEPASALLERIRAGREAEAEASRAAKGKSRTRRARKETA